MPHACVHEEGINSMKTDDKTHAVQEERSLAKSCQEDRNRGRRLRSLPDPTSQRTHRADRPSPGLRGGGVCAHFRPDFEDGGDGFPL